ncbi:hypothetical protein BH10BAC5_BH10BAC5_19530 [soil metagenome]
MKNYYDILEVAYDASYEEIKRAYRRLALKYHPDTNPETGSESRFKNIVEAYEILSHKVSRENYDRYYRNEIPINSISYSQNKNLTLFKHKNRITILSVILIVVLIFAAYYGNKERKYSSVEPVFERYNKYNFNYYPACEFRSGNFIRLNLDYLSDAAVKLMDSASNVCIRYVFIKAGTYYVIEDIPDGKYYTKVAFGSDWIDSVSSDKHFERFSKNAEYKKSSYVFTFSKENKDAIPQTVYLDPGRSLKNNSEYPESVITEEEFNR